MAEYVISIHSSDCSLSEQFRHRCMGREALDQVATGNADCTLLAVILHSCMPSGLQQLYINRAPALNSLLAAPPRYFLWSRFTQVREAEDLSHIQQGEERGFCAISFYDSVYIPKWKPSRI